MAGISYPYVDRTGNPSYTSSPVLPSTSPVDGYVEKAFSFDFKKFYGKSTSEISRDFNLDFGVLVDIEPLLRKITFKGYESRVKNAIAELKKIDIWASPWYSGTGSTLTTPRSCYPGTASTSTYLTSSLYSSGTTSTSTSLSPYNLGTGSTSTTSSSTFSRGTVSSQTNYSKVKTYFGNDVAKIHKFCNIELRSGESVGILKADFIQESQPICLRLTCLAFENLFNDKCERIEQKIQSLHKRQVLGIPYHKHEQAKKITGQVNQDTLNDCLAIFNPEHNMIELYDEYSYLVSELQMKIETALDTKSSETSTSSVLANRTPVSVNSNHNLEKSHGKPGLPKTSAFNTSQFYSKFETGEGLKVKFYCCSITDLQVDAIVNAANDQLQHVGGVAKAISDAAGPRLDSECFARLKFGKGYVDVTENIVTRGYNLRCPKVIHAVGPQWKTYSDKTKCLEDLCRTVEKVLLAAENNAAAIVAMPAISSGIFGVPQDLCAEMYVHSIMEFSSLNKLKFLKEVHIVDINDTILKKIHLAYQNWKMDPKSVSPIYAATNHPKLMKSTRMVSQKQDSDVDMQTEHSINKTVPPLKEKSKSFRGNIPNMIKILEIPDSTIPKTQIVVKNFQVGGLLEIKIYTGSIVRVSGMDAIVCSADKYLSGIGLLSKSIETAGGPHYEDSFRKLRSKHTLSNIGDVYSCKAGKIRVNYVVHVVMDQLFATDARNLHTYKQNLTAVLEQTNAWNMKALAIPLIGAGFIEKNLRDLGLCCKTLLEAICEFCQHKGQKCGLQEIHLINKNSSITDQLVHTFKSNASKPSIRAKSAAISRPKTENYESSHSLDDISLSFHGNKRHSESNKWRGARPKQLSRSISAGDAKLVDVEPMESEDSDLTLARRLQDEENTKTSKKKRQRGNINILGDVDFADDSSKNYGRKGDPDLKKALALSMKENHSRKDDTNHKCDGCDFPSSDNESLPCGHSFCSVCFIPMKSNRICTICSTTNAEITSDFKSKDTTDESQEKQKETDCVICMDKIKNGKKLKCGHEFCEDCISDAFKHKPACPMCGSIFGKVLGNQPDDGEMKVHTDNFPSLPGFEEYGTIVIKYVFPDGYQKENHPNPGKKYKGTERTAYLPDNPEGRKILKMLKVAWKRKLIFTIGSSRTTGQENVVTWNDIHHKTKRFPGAEFGFPDAGYFDRVKDELAAKGVTENDI